MVSVLAALGELFFESIDNLTIPLLLHRVLVINL